MTKPPNIVIIIPETRLIVTNTLNLNFFRKTFTIVESVYHQALPPNNTPISNMISVEKVGVSPNTDVPAKTAIKTTTVTGFDTVKKNRDKKSPNNPFFVTLRRAFICFRGLAK